MSKNLQFLFLGFLFVYPLTIVCQENDKIEIPEQLVPFAVPNTPKRNVQFTASQWTKKVLNPNFLPPENSLYIILPRTHENDWDKLQLSYRVNENIVTIVQSYSLFAIQITNPNWPQEQILGITTIQKQAKELFIKSDGLELLSDGNQGTAKNRKQENAPWLESLRWQKKGQSIIFVFLKYPGEPIAANQSFAPAFNERWFSEPDSKK